MSATGAEGERDQPPEASAHLVARDVVRALVAGGVRDVVLAPGSRSAPLAHALHSAERAGWLRLTVRVDERVAAFVALGLSRAGELEAPAGLEPARARRPVAVVTTSGTAVANLHPAVLEADAAGVPLVLLTADRPHELRGTGANQTTDQVGLFGPALRHLVDVPADAPAGPPLTQHVARALAAATGARTREPGPVQLNLGFREPLAPERTWVPGQAPAVRPVARPDHARSSVPLGRGPRTVVVAGDGAGPEARRLAERGGWPLLAEPTSGSRGGRCAVSAYRELLDLAQLGGRVQRVVVAGHPTLSRPVTRLLAREDLELVVASPSGRWPDAAGTARTVAAGFDVEGQPGPDEQAWLDLWLDAGRSVVARLAHPAAGPPDDGTLDALATAAVVAGAARHSGTLVLGASRVVRDIDLVGQPWMDPVPHVLSNRGLAGIDGTISTAVGLARGTGRPVRVLLGDLTLLHDVGGLLLGALEDDVDVQVVVADDSGGAIFALLGHADASPDGFARLFTTPQLADLEALARGYGADYRAPRTLDELQAVLAAPILGRSVVHVRIGERRAETSRARSLI
ncbi:2-succinyl-5-enolpyruvyl-6-hydroxy-3-cyclohexene-1-carboxylic-acid synthase [Georgenia sp. Z1491]|uniref:2-succinyl-5-enolpyruvyl-6-hydroxy-3- cyclohexene-1-carboxylic-acid synthase n=1 Tax=Georgenia sp. Z1491 TaxID=3416707 RepID=UPI003CF78CD6